MLTNPATSFRTNSRLFHAHVPHQHDGDEGLSPASSQDSDDILIFCQMKKLGLIIAGIQGSHRVAVTKSKRQKMELDPELHRLRAVKQRQVDEAREIIDSSEAPQHESLDVEKIQADAISHQEPNWWSQLTHGSLLLSKGLGYGCKKYSNHAINLKLIFS